MDWYSINVECHGTDGDVVTDEAIDRFADSLAVYSGGGVTGGPGYTTYGARVSVPAMSALQAGQEAVTAVVRASTDAGMPIWPVVRIEAVREDVFDDDLVRPQLPELVDAVEGGQMLGVTTQRFRALAAAHPDFPAAFIDRPHAKLWVRPAVERFLELWERKPGRPSSAA